MWNVCRRPIVWRYLCGRAYPHRGRWVDYGGLEDSGYREIKFGGDVTVNLNGGSMSGNLIGSRANTPAPKYTINWSGGIYLGGGQIDGQLTLRKTAKVQAPASGGITLQGGLPLARPAPSC